MAADAIKWFFNIVPVDGIDVDGNRSKTEEVQRGSKI